MEKKHVLSQAMHAALSRRRFLTKSVISAATVAGMATFGTTNPAFASSFNLTAPALQQFQQPYGHLSVLGHDISTLQQLESVGKTFSDNGRVLPAERILAHHGATYIRERLWVNPPMPFNDLPHILTMAKRIKAAGLKFLLDFHYSDFWADPGKQPTPASWQGQDLATLATTVYNYTVDVLVHLAAQGTPPDMVQTGNEVTNGMLWPLGEIYVNGSQNWPQFTTLLKAAIAGVRHAAPCARVMVHIDRGGDNGGSEYFYDHILAQGVNFDVIGLSYYPWWHGPLSALQANLNALGPRYNKDIVLAETAYPWTLTDGDGYANSVSSSSQLLSDYPATPAGQLAYIREVLSIVSQVPNQRGLGIVYWEPAWIPGVGWEPGAGNAWDNMTLFDFNGAALPSIVCYQQGR
jgi:arabinogalactan endo-1,4-beta-galactosidase